MIYKSLANEEKWIIKGIPILFIISSAIHSLYNLTSKCILFAIIAPSNESIWEHSKMVILPIILWYSLYYIAKRKDKKIDINKWSTAMLSSLIISIVSIFIVFYLYFGMFGGHYLWADILTLFIAILLGQLLALHIYRKGKGISFKLILVFTTIILVAYLILTFFPPHIPLFKDFSIGIYGIA
ncbi:MAG: DUF6512 family protein [Clostridia bacterium]